MSKNILTIFNVGQGDSFLLKPDMPCIFDDAPLLIDCGHADKKVVDKIGEESISVMLTHSHRDHIGGFPNVLKKKHVEQLYVPFYMPEVMAISKFVSEYITKAYASFDWEKFKSENMTLLKEGDKLCDHGIVLNPPVSLADIYPEIFDPEDATDIPDIGRALNTLRDFGMNLPIGDITDYRCPEIFSNIETGTDQSYSELAKQFVHSFFISLVVKLRASSNLGINFYTEEKLKLTSNQASVVFLFNTINDENDQYDSWLFTGDADISVFERLIKKGVPIKAKYLKVPHHGSSHNLNQNIIHAINPEVAIISHNNRGYRGSLDPHPHNEVINLLDTAKVRTYYTNDVKKLGSVIRCAAPSSVEKGKIRFV